ncbi:MAG: hypothetical protein P8186_16500 [Anaerolineae bacterium]
MMSGVTDPGEAPPGGEAYAGWLVNFIGWVEQGQAEICIYLRFPLGT